MPQITSKGLFALAIVNFLVSLIIAALLIGNIRAIRDVTDFNSKLTQRNQAMDEMLYHRAEIQQWMYERICEHQKAENKPCYTNPQWWADPKKYPLIANDPSGTGLFPQDIK